MIPREKIYIQINVRLDYIKHFTIQEYEKRYEIGIIKNLIKKINNELIEQTYKDKLENIINPKETKWMSIYRNPEKKREYQRNYQRRKSAIPF